MKDQDMSDRLIFVVNETCQKVDIQRLFFEILNLRVFSHTFHQKCSRPLKLSIYILDFLTITLEAVIWCICYGRNSKFLIVL